MDLETKPSVDQGAVRARINALEADLEDFIATRRGRRLDSTDFRHVCDARQELRMLRRALGEAGAP